MNNATIKNNTIIFLTNKIVKHYAIKHNGTKNKILNNLYEFSKKEECEIHLFLKSINFDFYKNFDIENKKFSLCGDWYIINFNFSDKISSKTNRSFIKNYNITIKTHKEIIEEVEKYIQENLKA